MTFVTAQARIMALLNVAGVIAHFPGGPKEIVRGCSVATDTFPALFLVEPFDMSRADAGDIIAVPSVRTYGFEVVALFVQAQDAHTTQAATIAAAVDAVIAALEGKALQSTNNPKALALEPIKVRNASQEQPLAADESYLQFVFSCTGQAFETP